MPRSLPFAQPLLPTDQPLLANCLFGFDPWVSVREMHQKIDFIESIAKKRFSDDAIVAAEAARHHTRAILELIAMMVKMVEISIRQEVKEGNVKPSKRKAAVVY